MFLTREVVLALPIVVSPKLNLKKLIVGSTESKKETYSLIAGINFTGRTNIVDGCYYCTLFAEDDVAIRFDDSFRKGYQKLPL